MPHRGANPIYLTLGDYGPILFHRYDRYCTVTVRDQMPHFVGRVAVYRTIVVSEVLTRSCQL